MSISFKLQYSVFMYVCLFVHACVCMYLSNRFGTNNGENEVLLLQNHVTLCRYCYQKYTKVN